MSDEDNLVYIPECIEEFVDFLCPRCGGRMSSGIENTWYENHTFKIQWEIYPHCTRTGCPYMTEDPTYSECIPIESIDNKVE